MTKKTYALILKAVRAQQAKGFRIGHMWGITNPSGRRYKSAGGDCLCPMACVILERPDTRSACRQRVAAQRLGGTYCQVTSFIDGFDASGYDSNTDMAWLEAGKRMAKELGV